MTASRVATVMLLLLTEISLGLAQSAEVDRAGALAAAGRKDEAAQLLAQHLALQPTDVDGWSLAGRVAMARLDSNGAVSAYERLCAIDPHSELYLLQLVDALTLAGRENEALARLETHLATHAGAAQAAASRATLAREAEIAKHLRQRSGWLTAAVLLILGLWIGLLVVLRRTIGAAPTLGGGARSISG